MDFKLVFGCFCVAQPESDLLVGVELLKPKGDCDGTFMGVKCFECPPNFGVFAKPANVRWYRPACFAPAAFSNLIDFCTLYLFAFVAGGYFRP